LTREFIDLAKGFNDGVLTPEQLKSLHQEKEALAAKIMALPAEQVFDKVAAMTKE